MITAKFIQRTLSVSSKRLWGIFASGVSPAPATKFFRPDSLFQSRRLLSSNPTKNLKFLSEVEDYVERDFVLTDLKKKFDDENLPALVTTSSLLDQCETLDDVLRELQKAIMGGKLWKDELVLYFQALLRVRRPQVSDRSGDNFSAGMSNPELENRSKLLEDFRRDETSIANREKLLNDPYFQFLLKEILLHSPRFISSELSYVFYSFVLLEIPPSSNAMSLLITVLQHKINELFPSHVLQCFIAIRKIAHHQSRHIHSLYDGLFLHLENQALDSPTFLRILMQCPLVHQLRLLKYVYGLGSPELMSLIKHGIAETIKQRPDRRLRNMQEAINVLVTLMVSYVRRPRYMLNAATKFFTENEELMTADHRFLIKTALKKIPLTDSNSVQQLQALSEKL